MKKEIFLVTRFNIYNQGSVLQTIATQEFFKNLGFNVIVVNFIENCEKPINLARALLYHHKDFERKKIKKSLYILLKSISIFFSFFKFSRYQKKYIFLGKRIKNKNDLIKKYGNSNLIFCAGSDQLRGPISNGELSDFYFLSFTNSSFKFSFSSSVGRTIELKTEYLTYLKNFDFITVREKTLCDYLLHEKITNVHTILDPTMMIETDFWYNLCRNLSNKRKYIFYYRIHANKELDNKVKEFAINKGIEVCYVSNSIFSLKNKGWHAINVDPIKYLSLIRDAQYVICDSFHGTVFSIIFKKQFLSYLPPNTSIRLKDLLSEFKLEDRALNNDFCLAFIDETIDYNTVHKELYKKQNFYKEIFLKKFNEMICHMKEENSYE